MSHLRWLITELLRHLWVRATLFAVAGILTAVAGIALAPLLPADWSGRIGAEAIGNVLEILASSMLMDAWWRAANYLSVGQIYLLDNPLLREPLKRSHIKPRLLGHWGTTPGLNFIYAHMNRVIKQHDLT
jgi:hypothetical protein